MVDPMNDDALPRPIAPESPAWVPEPEPAALAVDIAALLGSRICHDLISPLGAIGNGLELLALSGAASGPEMRLIDDAVFSANARLRFFRLAFGAAGGGQNLGEPEVVSCLEAIARGGRLRLDWQVEGDAPRHEVKLAFLALLCLETALPWGGVIRLRRAGQAWQISGAEGRIKLDADLWAALAAGRSPAQASPAQVQFLLLPAEIATAGRQLTVAASDDGITLAF